jgi:GDP/UDP-N,N'-diacetylbacillosamine 2-epimerase (hydrolysing)
MRKICVITGTRAEYGLLRWIMQAIKADPDLLLQLIVTGTHLSKDHGLTYKFIEEDGFNIDSKIDILTVSDSAVDIAKSIGLAVFGFAEALDKLKPDLIVVLGDRFEVFSAVSAALVAKIPVAHIHGGEVTVGSYDDAFRHSITKMAHLHFVAAEPYRQRIIQLGEKPEHIFLVGGLGVDAIKRLQLLDKSNLERLLGFKFNSKNLLITFHPATLDNIAPEIQMKELLAAFSELKDTQLIFTLPNADTGSRSLIKMIKNFVKENSNAYVFESLGQLNYLSLIAHVDAVVGNSSSGLIEAPSFSKGTINIGSRQRGRLQAKSVINCEPIRESILNALCKLYSSEFQKNLKNITNPYGEGGASEKVVKVLKESNLLDITKKIFNDFSVNISLKVS